MKCGLSEKNSRQVHPDIAFAQVDDIGRNIAVPLFNAQAFEQSTSNSLRQSIESNVGVLESTGTAQIIRLVERLRDLQRIVLPTQVIEAPDGCVINKNIAQATEYHFYTVPDTKLLKKAYLTFVKLR